MHPKDKFFWGLLFLLITIGLITFFIIVYGS